MFMSMPASHRSLDSRVYERSTEVANTVNVLIHVLFHSHRQLADRLNHAVYAVLTCMS